MERKILLEQIAQQQELVNTTGNLYDQTAHRARLEELKAQLKPETPKKTTPKDK